MSYCLYNKNTGYPCLFSLNDYERLRKTDEWRTANPNKEECREEPHIVVPQQIEKRKRGRPSKNKVEEQTNGIDK